MEDEIHKVESESNESSGSTSQNGGDGTKRQTWSSQLDFIMTAIGTAVGLGNIWRFPYLCYKNGGGAFLIPYILSFFVVSVPTYILEISLGQYTSSGCIRAWKVVPALQGIGFAQQVVVFFESIYYIIVIAWGLYYLAVSLTSQLPWATCDNEWNTKNCFVTGMVTSSANCTNVTSGMSCSLLINETAPRVDAVVEFWERKALKMSSGLGEPGSLVPGLVVALLVAWFLVFICICKGVKWTGKVVYVTVIFPYILLTILLVKGLTLEGALDGLTFYLKPDFSRLMDAKVWMDGGTQILFSSGLGQGYMTALGSYNKFHSKSVRNGLVVLTVNSLTSLYGGLIVFSILGFMANEAGVPIAKVVESGPGLIFMAYPKAVTQLPLSPLWAALFFIMVLFVGLDSEFGAVEGLLTPIMDMFPRTLYKSRNRILFVAGYCVLAFLLGLPMVTEGGVFLFKLMDYYSATGLILLIIVCGEVLAIGWIFGADRFYDVLELMTGKRYNIFFKLCWKFLTPLVVTGIFLFEVATFKPLAYKSDLPYPAWGTALGLCLVAASSLWIPVVFVYRLASSTGTIAQRWKDTTTPIIKKHQVDPRWQHTNYRWKLQEYQSYDVNNAYDEDNTMIQMTS